jgi:hypothetical protein
MVEEMPVPDPPPLLQIAAPSSLLDIAAPPLSSHPEPRTTLETTPSPPAATDPPTQMGASSPIHEDMCASSLVHEDMGASSLVHEDMGASSPPRVQKRAVRKMTPKKKIGRIMLSICMNWLNESIMGFV